MGYQMEMYRIDAEIQSLQRKVEELRSGEPQPSLFLQLRSLRDQQDTWLDKRIQLMRGVGIL